MKCCPNCNSSLKIIHETIYECTNDSCVFMIKALDYERLYGQIDEVWYKKAAHDSSYWCDSAFHQLPSIMAHEYHRLYQMLMEGQIYGALLQMKDVFEVILKYPVLLVVSEIAAKKVKTDDDLELIHDCLKKPLNLGEWRDMANIIWKKKLTQHPLLLSILKNIKKIYFNQELDIVKWRNTTIGHGALQFDDEVSFQHEFIERLEIIRDHFAHCLPYYEKISFFTKVKGKEVILHGHSKATKLPDGAKTLLLKIDRQEYPLDPFIIINEHEVYFFDSYIYKKYKVSVLNYPRGYKKDYFNFESLTKYFQEQYESSVEHLMASGKRKELIRIEDSVEMDSFFFENEKLVESLDLSEEVYPQIHLTEWLSQLLENKRKGVFLLQMERGMGKSTFTRMLDENSLNTEKLDDTNIRAYYVNDSYLADLDYFISYLSDIFRLDAQGQLILREKNIHLIDRNSTQRPLEFINFLTHYQQLYNTKFQKSKLLFIFDGIDELPTGSSILDFIPNPEQLPENVFILLTSRTEEELSPFISSCMERLNLPEECCKTIRKTDPENLECLRLFLESETSLFATAEQNLLKLSDYRFLYASMIKYLLKYEDTLIELDAAGSELYTLFLEKLKRIYGKKHFEKIEKLLLILAIQKEHLTIKELTYLLGDEYITFEHLAYFSDIKGLINKERSYRGNLLSLHNNELKEYIIKHYKENIKALIHDWIHMAKADLTNECSLNEISAGQGYLFAYLVDYIKEWGIEEGVFDPAAAADSLFEMAETMREQGTYSHINKRYMKIYQTIVNEISSDSGIEAILSKMNAISRLGDQFFVSATLIDQEEAIKHYQEAVQLREQHLNEFEAVLEDRDEETKEKLQPFHKNIQLELIDERINIGRIFYKVGMYQEALDIYEPALEDLEIVCDLEKKEHLWLYSNGLLDLARALARTHQGKQSIKVANEVFNLQQRYSSTDINYYSMTARTLHTMGEAHYYNGKLNFARREYRKAHKIIKNSYISPKMIRANQKFEAVLLVMIGNTYLNQNHFSQAVPYYEDALKIYHQCSLEGIECDAIFKMEAHRNIGQCFLDEGKNKKAIEHFETALKILAEEMPYMNENHYGFRSTVNPIYLGLADSHYLNRNFQEAIENYDVWLKFIEIELEKGMKLHSRDLITTLERMHHSFKELKQHKREREYQTILKRAHTIFSGTDIEIELQSYQAIIGKGDKHPNPARAVETDISALFQYDHEREKIVSCSNNREPIVSRNNTKKKYFTIEFSRDDCQACESNHCPGKKKTGVIKVSYRTIFG